MTDPFAYLFALEQFGIKFGLDNIRRLLGALDHPERAFRSIHIAGTNGKGSVTAMVDHALRSAGHRSGRYTSPHLVHLSERFVVNGRAVDDMSLAAAIDTVRRAIESLTAIAAKACVTLLKEFPRFNSSVDMEQHRLIYKKYYHVGIAVDTEHGLVVPVVRDADRKHIADIAAEIDDFARRAKERKLDIKDMQGATFTISNQGGIGGTAFSPIVSERLPS